MWNGLWQAFDQVWDFGNVGAPFPCLEIKLVDVPEMGYNSHTDPPKGELWVRGASVSIGYYKNEAKTKEEFESDGGWFKTGDVAQWNANGTVSIIDRKKNLVKPPHGEYIAVERLESTYKNSLFVNNIYVHADPHHNELIAFVMPNRKHLEEWAHKNGVPADDFEALCNNPKAVTAVIEDLGKVWRANALRSMERIDAVVLFSTEWTAENGWLTTALKLRRFDIKVKQKDLIESTYAELKGGKK